MCKRSKKEMALPRARRYEFGANGVAEGVRQAVQEGEISQTTADEIVRLIDERLEGGPASLSGKIFVLGGRGRHDFLCYRTGTVSPRRRGKL